MVGPGACRRDGVVVSNRFGGSVAGGVVIVLVGWIGRLRVGGWWSFCFGG